MLTGLHFLLTYRCTHECDHCFLHCGPGSPGTFSLSNLEAILDDARRIDTLEKVYFEGGEPFLYFPLLVAGIRAAKARGFSVGLVTNAYWASTEQDARLWIEPLLSAGLSDMAVSDDALHWGSDTDNPARRALRAAESLGLSAWTLATATPPQEGVVFRGRAADTLTAELPRLPPGDLEVRCPEELVQPSRVHVGPYGEVHLCQGVLLGNALQTPLSALLQRHDPEAHPICGPLLAGGPARLAEVHGLSVDRGYVSTCHFCYAMRQSLLTSFPRHLGPPQVYGPPPS